ncbi:30S ribosome-binding factor RbfA [Candidatus Protochlamydia phocaeensis]|uniref:30S ribosome-binding factor RbfA n=1 Tax=Candidatus Protochlamydia phocaeensis TaxID=1414722 RepID=UPI000839641C|nr:30S ribosome-binding factor RbfA [Candidatus Protochlamydia phocaeensis]
MAVQRTDRLNSLLKEVISEVIKRDVRNPHVTELVTVTRVQISKDLHHAKVYISVIGTEQEKAATIEALRSAAGFIAVNASQKVVMRYFPELTFKLDDSVEKHMRIEELLGKISKERESRQKDSSSDDTEEHEHPSDS